MNATPLLATADSTANPPTSRMCRLDLPIIPARRPTASGVARPAKRGLTRSAFLKLGLTIVAIELVIAGSLRLGVGAPEAAPAVAKIVRVAPRAHAHTPSARVAPAARPAVAPVTPDETQDVADATSGPHLQGGPTGFGTF